MKLKRLILLTPYDQDTNDHEIDYLRQIGLTVVHDVALALPGSDDYLAQPPERWVELAVEHARDDADGYFLSCTNTTQIEAIEPIERKLGKPVVNSNQAVLWACMKRLRHKLGPARNRRRGLGDWSPAAYNRPGRFGVTMNDVNTADRGPALFHARPHGDVQRQCAEDRPVRLELLVRPRGHPGAGALDRQLGGQPGARQDVRRCRHRVHAAGRPLEGLRRRHRLHGHVARDHHLGDRACSPTPSG